jgi:hypothetical protein
MAIIAIAVFLMLSMSASMMLMPTAKAHKPAWQIPTYAFINVEPNPIGVGQQVNVIMWLDKVIYWAGIGNDIRFANYNLTITIPGGTTQTTIFPVVQDTTSAQNFYYTPTKVGTYTFTFTFPGQVYTWTGLQPSPLGPGDVSAYTGDTYLPSSASTTLTVQQAAIIPASSSPFPTAYWTRPIYGENSAWWTISSDWLGYGSPNYNGWTGGVFPVQESNPGDAIGPQTAHVMWTKPLDSGGIVGGNNFAIQGDSYFEGSAYLDRFQNPIILDGMLYYTEPIGVSESGGFMNPQTGPTDCVNLQTGQLIWSKTTVPALSFGYIYDMQNPDYHGVWQPMLVAVSGTSWLVFDADTGDALFTAINVPSGTKAMNPENGEYLQYVLTNLGTPTKPNYYLGLWNFTDVIPWGMFDTPLPVGTVDASAPSCYSWNVSVPWATFGSSITIVCAYYDHTMICYNSTLPAGGAAIGMMTAATWSSTPYTYFAANLNPSNGALGSILWTNTLQPPPGNLTVLEGGVDPTTGVFTEVYRETVQFVGYSMATGQKLWGPTPSEDALYPLAYYGNQFSGITTAQFDEGNMYISSLAGVMFCYNDTTGTLKWTYGNGGEGNSSSAGYNNGYGDYPTFIEAIGNGVLYTLTAAHTVETPIYKGALVRAINATNGKEVWTLSDYGSGWDLAIADGYATFFNGYDNQIYSVGRGPSATTVNVQPFGTDVVIRGTVMDISAGTKQTEQAADFPNGVPCASDASMKDWMEYVYQQQPEPTNFTGVQVTISVLDSNGNCYKIGTATTNAWGMYTLTWAPIIPGNYTVYANFAGTNGYWPSSDTTSFYASPPAPTAPPTAAPVTGLASTGTVELGIAAVIIVIVIIGVVLAVLMMRKHA